LSLDAIKIVKNERHANAINDLRPTLRVLQDADPFYPGILLARGGCRVTHF